MVSEYIYHHLLFSHIYKIYTLTHVAVVQQEPMDITPPSVYPSLLMN